MDNVVLPPSFRKQKPFRKQKLAQARDTWDGTDIISNLEDNLLHHILSFLKTNDAIRTSVLSRRWQFLWTSISDIKLYDSWHAYRKASESKDRPSFLEFVDRVFLLHDASDIERFVLYLTQPVTSYRLNSWICTAMRHNLQDLELRLRQRPKTPFVFSCFLFTCDSLRVLKLEMDCDLKPPTFVHLSHLKTLHLHQVTFVDEDSTERLFSGCPVLEELELVDCEWKNIRNVKITSPTLKKLKFHHDDMESIVCVINIYAANLISLDCLTYLGVDVHSHDLCSLVSASIYTLSVTAERVVSARRVFNLFASAYNVKSLATAEDSIESLTETENLLDHLPTFHNLTNLTMSTGFDGRESSSRALMDLLEKLPKLGCIEFAQGFIQYASFKESYFLDRVPSCIENSLETFIISVFMGDPAEFHMLRYFLKNAKKLKKITLIHYDHIDDKKLRKKLRNQLKRLPKGPENCLVELLFI